MEEIRPPKSLSRNEKMVKESSKTFVFITLLSIADEGSDLMVTDPLEGFGRDAGL